MTMQTLMSTLGRVNADLIVKNYHTQSGAETLVVKNHFKSKDDNLVIRLNEGSLTAHKSELNLSITGKVEGYVEVSPADTAAFHDAKVPCYKVRTINLIKNGEWVLPEITVKIAVADLPRISAYQAAFTSMKMDGEFMLIDIYLPVILPPTQVETDLSRLYDLSKTAIERDAIQKVLNFLLNKIDFVSSPIFTPYQAKILEKYGVNSQGLYNPVSVTIANDTPQKNVVITFQFKGMTTLPKVEDAISKTPKNEIWALMAQTYADFVNASVAQLVNASRLNKETISNLRYNLCIEKMMGNPLVIFNGNNHKNMTIKIS